MSRRRNKRSEERRRHFFGVLLKLTVLVAVVGTVAYYAYEVGFRVAAGEVGTLKDELQQALDTADGRQGELDKEQSLLSEARQQAESYRTLYEQTRPNDEIRDLTTILRAKLATGMDARRLGFVIKSARNPHDCEMLGSKRFLVRTPRYRGPDASTVARLDDEVTLSAEGAGANGGHEQWFDPDRPVKVRVTASGAKNTDLGGTLPLEHAIAVKNSEYHLTMTAASARGWVEVLTERCNFR